MTEKLQLDEHYKSIQCPPYKRKIEIPDRTIVKGLYLEKRALGSTWWFRFTNPTTSRLSHIKVGPGDALTLGQARDIARKLRSRVALGEDPKGELDAAKNEMTYAQYMEEHFLPFVKTINRPSSTKRNQSHYDLYLKEAFGSMQLNQIKKQDLVRLQSKLLSEGTLRPASINRILSTCTGSITRANSAGYIERAISNFKQLKENNKSEAWLTREEADRLLKELPLHLRNISKMCLYTGLRSSNLTELVWTEVDIDRKLIIIGAEKAKGKRPITVPLIPEAITLLEQLKKQNEESERPSEFVFLYKGLPFERVTNSAWYKACQRANVTAKFHTLRHTWASWHVQSGTNLYDLQALGAWSDVRMVQRYGHLSAERVQQSAHNISGFGIDEAS